VPMNPELGPSIQAFVLRDYRRCTHLAGALLEKKVALEPAHLLLTSYLRLDHAKDADDYALRYMAALTDPWEQAMVGLTVGRGNLDRIFDDANSDLRRLQLIYYFGAFQVSRHMHKEARETFGKYLLSSMPPISCMELYLMGIENNYLTSGASGSDLDKPVIELNTRASQLFNEKKHAPAEEAAQQAYDLAGRTLGELHPAYLTALHNLGAIRHMTGQCAEARPLLEKHAELLRLAAGPEDPAYAGALVTLALNLLKGRQPGQLLDLDRVESLLRQALEIQQKALGDQHADVASTRDLLAQLAQARQMMAAPRPSPPPPPPAAEKKPAQGFWAKMFGRQPKAEPMRATYGFTAEDPILCHEPLGEMQFLISLRCPNGHRLRGSRAGSLSGKCTAPASHTPRFPGSDPAESCVVDRYDSVCDGGEYKCTLYFDMYHPGLPPQPAPRGLTRVESA
jgi:hypothetical protein